MIPLPTLVRSRPRPDCSKELIDFSQPQSDRSGVTGRTQKLHLDTLPENAAFSSDRPNLGAGDPMLQIVDLWKKHQIKGEPRLNDQCVGYDSNQKTVVSSTELCKKAPV